MRYFFFAYGPSPRPNNLKTQPGTTQASLSMPHSSSIATASWGPIKRKMGGRGLALWRRAERIT